VDVTAEQDAAPRPLLRVVRGEPSAEEVAALVAVLAARASAAVPAAAPVVSLWGRPVLRSVPHPDLHPGPGAWRASGLPR
jgi:Acyl-CoA carboxylase epsilon subunit